MLELRPLLARWRKAPSALLADVIDTLPTNDVPGLARPSERVAWAEEAIVRRDPADLRAILEICREQRSMTVATGLLEGLAAWPADPRLTTCLRDWLDRPPWTSSAGQKAWGRAFKLLAKVPDSRVAGLLPYDGVSRFGELRAAWVTAKLEKLRGGPDHAVTPAEEAAWTAHLREHRKRLAQAVDAREQADQLLARVYAEPADLLVRQVLADALLDLDDPRGELLQLQLGPPSRASREREKALLGAHQAAWLGAMHDVLMKGGRVWRNGFLAECRLRIRSEVDAARAAVEPGWSLVEVLDLGRSVFHMDGLPTLLHGADWRSLRVVRGVMDPFELGQVLAMDVPLEELELATVKYAYREDRTPARAARHIPRIVMEGGWVEQRLPVVVGRLTCDTLEVRVQEGAFLHADPATAPAMLADLVSIGDRVLFRVLSGSAEHACIESVAVGVTARVDPAASPALRRAVDMVRSTL